MMEEFAIKVSPFGGEYGGGAMGGKGAGLWRGGSTNHYLFGVQTNSEMGTNHYLFVVQITIGL